MKLEQAQAIAQKYWELLAPYCVRIEIAGSIRREKEEVKDIEIVCIPRTYFDTRKRKMLRAPQFIYTMIEMSPIKGKPTDKYIQFLLPEGIKLDLFTAHPDNWGYILAIRTGSADYSHNLAIEWVKAGYKGIEGMLHKNGVPVPVREERDLFALIGVKYVEPQYRNLNLTQG